MYRYISSLACAAAALAALLAWPEAAAGGIRQGLGVCAEVIIPSLFPFFVLGSALSELAVPERLGRRLAPLMRAFGARGEAAAPLLMGLLGGYPLGAAGVASLRARSLVPRGEAARLLGFCNNSGPAFLIGAAGAGVFGSARAGAALYAAHVLAALSAGIVLRGGGKYIMSTNPPPPEPRPGAFARAVTASVGNVLNVCGFVLVFSAATSALESAGVLTRLAGELSLRTPLEFGPARALLRGFFELGGGISALRGCAPTRGNFALAALLVGWGGLSVHMQTAAAAGDIGMGRHALGRCLSAAFGALYAYMLWPLAGLG